MHNSVHVHVHREIVYKSLALEGDKSWGGGGGRYMVLSWGTPPIQLGGMRGAL